MSRQKAHLLLSDLHRIFGSYDVEDFIRAATISPNMAKVLAAIHDHKDGTAEKAEMPSPVQTSAREGRTDSDPGNDLESILADLRRSIYFTSVRDLEGFGSKNGIKIKAHRKEARERFARRIAHALMNLPRSAKNGAFRDIIEHSPTQTAGWVKFFGRDDA